MALSRSRIGILALVFAGAFAITAVTFDAGTLLLGQLTPSGSLTVLLSTDGQNFAPSVSAAPGQTITVHLLYDNDGTIAAKNTSIEAQIPSGFTRVRNSTKNCMTPSGTETICNTDAGQSGPIRENVWNGPSLMIAPTAGLYGVDPGQMNGIFETGKTHYLNYRDCDNANPPPPAGNYDTDDNYTFTPGNTPLTVSDCPQPSTGTLRPSPFSFRDSTDMSGKRYANEQTCTAQLANLRNSDGQMRFTPGNQPLTSLDCNTMWQTLGLQPDPNWHFYPPYSYVDEVDQLGDRYLNYMNCDYIDMSLVPGTSEPNGDTHDVSFFAPGNTPRTVHTCPAVDAFGNTLRTQQSYTFALAIDVLDRSRGKGYVAFQMIAPATVGAYTQGATIHGDSLLTSSSAGTITIAAAPGCSAQYPLCTGSNTPVGAVCPPGQTPATPGEPAACHTTAVGFCYGCTGGSSSSNSGGGGGSAASTSSAAALSCVCGDYVITPPEECDNGIKNSDTTPDACRTTCVKAHCGDHVIDTGEQCDDGNTVNGDGCSSNCQIESSKASSSAGASSSGAAHSASSGLNSSLHPVAPVCGDGIREGSEQCDDGNTASGDGCSSTCTIERGWSCIARSSAPGTGGGGSSTSNTSSAFAASSTTTSAGIAQNSSISSACGSSGLTEYPVPSQFTQLHGIATGPDGNLWFTDARGDSSKIWRSTPTGSMTAFLLPTVNSSVAGIVAGPDGNLWFAEADDPDHLDIAKIGRITTTGTITEFPLSGRQIIAANIAAGPDGNLWFTESVAKKIGRITPSGTITEFPLPAGTNQPGGIVAGSDGNVWFNEGPDDTIGKITPSGVITEYPIGRRVQSRGLALGPDGNVWFSEPADEPSSKIAKITPSGAITEYPVPFAITANLQPEALVAGPDGNMWFSVAVANGQPGIFGRITMAGQVTRYNVPQISVVNGLTQGPHGNIWFTEGNRDSIGTFSPCGLQSTP